MYKFFLFFLLVGTYCFAQGTITIHSDFQQQTLNHSFEYYKDSLKIENSSSISTKEFNDNFPTFPGLTNSKFWFKFKVENKVEFFDKFIFYINTEAISDLVLYEKVEGNLHQRFQFEEKTNKFLEIPLDIRFGEGKELYFSIDFDKSIYFPVSLFSQAEFAKFAKKKMLYFGLYYGFSLVVLFVNLLFFFGTKNNFFIYYSGLLVAITFTLFELDGLFYLSFGDVVWIRHLDVLLHWFTLVFSVLFITESLQLKKYLPKFIYAGITVVLLNAVAYCIYVVTDKLIWYSVGEIINTLGLILYLSPCFVLFKKSIYARFALFAYLILFVSNVLYVLPSEFGMKDFGFTNNHLKVGGVIEMLVFLYAIAYRHKKIASAKEKLHGDLLEQKNKEEVLDKSSEEYFNSFCSYFLLSAREIEVARYILQGKMNKEIAYQLEIQETTIKYHVSNILKKLKIQNRTELSYKFAHFNTVNKGVTET
ncbi:LuxR C-terminal-related transcriptional regulator [Flavicella sediminum]|uniref:LuxR C-terminal-related transcriptional regulator n=1 Tax=Flavicella sediminum TaxID=2585141 RepID=UPI001120F5C6|nr:LuxR C-terminal-related transcriptional regulator [Flavicella sediminum]